MFSRIYGIEYLIREMKLKYKTKMIKDSVLSKLIIEARRSDRNSADSKHIAAVFQGKNILSTASNISLKNECDTYFLREWGIRAGTTIDANRRQCLKQRFEGV